jgi:hypothetical protein
VSPRLVTLSIGEEWGFEFRADASTDRGGYTQLGRTRNGVFL